MEKITIAGIVTLVILLSSGLTYYIQDQGSKTSCRNGFEYVSSGEYEGYYRCVTSSGERFEVCYEVYDSANTENYWCKKGRLVKIEEQEYVPSEGDWTCSSNGKCYRIN